MNELAFTVEAADIEAVGENFCGVKADHLSKIWVINDDTAQKTTDITFQLCSHDHLSHLMRQYSTNGKII